MKDSEWHAEYERLCAELEVQREKKRAGKHDRAELQAACNALDAFRVYWRHVGIAAGVRPVGVGIGSPKSRAAAAEAAAAFESRKGN